jgi:hypothetical protein
MKKIIKEYSQSDLEIDISKSGSSIKGNEMKSGGSLSPDFINILGYIFKSGITKGCKVTVTAGNDEWHKKNAPNSLHTKGNAIDLTISDKSCRQSLKNYIDGLKKQYPVSYLDEYEHPSAKSTGGHLHIQYGGTPLKSGDESTGVFSGISNASMGSSFIDTLTNVTKATLGLNESVSFPLKSQKRNSGTSKKYVINVLYDDKVVSPLDGTIDSIKKDNSNNLYTVEISHNYNGKKLKSVIKGFNESNVSDGDSVVKNKVIGKIYKNNTLTWELFDKKGKSLEITSLLNKDESDDNYTDKDKGNSEKTTLLKSMIGLNPVSLALKAGKEILQKESTQKTNVLTEEIQRIKNLMK